MKSDHCRQINHISISLNTIIEVTQFRVLHIYVMRSLMSGAIYTFALFHYLYKVIFKHVVTLPSTKFNILTNNFTSYTHEISRADIEVTSRLLKMLHGKNMRLGNK